MNTWLNTCEATLKAEKVLNRDTMSRDTLRNVRKESRTPLKKDELMGNSTLYTKRAKSVTEAEVMDMAKSPQTTMEKK
jgi:hypothetical protein